MANYGSNFQSIGSIKQKRGCVHSGGGKVGSKDCDIEKGKGQTRANDTAFISLHLTVLK